MTKNNDHSTEETMDQDQDMSTAENNPGTEDPQGQETEASEGGTGAESAPQAEGPR